MINLSKSGDTIVFEFVNNGHYLQNGTIEVPVNSLSLVMDSSNMCTFYKADSNDVFVSATYDELGKTKAEMLEWYEENMVGGGGGGVTSGQVQTMIDNSVSGKQDTLVSGTNIKTINNESILGSGNIDIQGGGKAIEAGRGISITTGETADTVSFNLPIYAGTGSYSIAEGFSTTSNGGYGSHAEGYQTTASGWGAHAEGNNTIASGYYSHTEGINNNANNNYEHASGSFNVSNKANSAFGDSGNTLFSVGNGTSRFTRHNAFEIRQNGDIYISKDGTDIKLQDHLGGGGASYSAGTGIDITNDVISVTGKVDTSTYTAYTAATEAVLSGKTSVVNLTQAEYDALVTGGTVDPTVLYNITDATAVDISQYWTSAQTNSAITQAVSGKADSSAVTQEISAAVSGKQDTLVSGTNIKTINNESILGSGNIDIQGGGGKAIEAGRGISITTGETADTISCKLPIYYSVGYTSIKSDKANVSGNRNIAWGDTAYVGSKGSSYIPDDAFAFGYYVNTYNTNEASFGMYNVSNQNTLVGGASGTTLFSVGNGTADNARHNAFEIRQNGDIYISSGGTDILLQDNLGGGGAVDQTIISGSTNAVAGGAVYSKIDEVEQVTAAGLNALNDAFGGLKLMKISQTDYDNLQVKDQNTLYVII